MRKVIVTVRQEGTKFQATLSFVKHKGTGFSVRQAILNAVKREHVHSIERIRRNHDRTISNYLVEIK